MGPQPWLHSRLFVSGAVLATLAFLLIFRNAVCPNPGTQLPLNIAESSDYAAMARGGTAQVESPFTKRFLFPWLAGTLARASGLPERVAFLVLDAASLTLLVGCVTAFVAWTGFSPWFAAAVLVTPSVIDRFELGYMPDLFENALLALFFLLLLRERIVAALVVLALAFMTRENTLVLCLVLGVLAWRAGRMRLAGGAVLVAGFGIVFGSFAERLGQPNRHHLPDFVYLGLKLPHEFLKNVFGFRLWSNTLEFGRPLFTIHLPAALHLGGVHEVGLCAPEFNIPTFTFVTLLTLFGAGPLWVWRARGEAWKSPPPLAVQLAGIYGLLAYLLGTSVGDWIDRLIGDGWPLFWLALPWLLARARERPVRFPFTACLLSLFALAWLPAVVFYSRFAKPGLGIAIIVVAVMGYVITWRVSGGLSSAGDSPAQRGIP